MLIATQQCYKLEQGTVIWRTALWQLLTSAIASNSDAKNTSSSKEADSQYQAMGKLMTKKAEDLEKTPSALRFDGFVSRDRSSSLLSTVIEKQL